MESEIGLNLCDETKRRYGLPSVQMFSGEKLVQEPVEERLLPSQYLKESFSTECG